MAGEKIDMEAHTLQVLTREPWLWERERSEEGTMAQLDPALTITHRAPRRGRAVAPPAPILQVSGQEPPQPFFRLGALYHLSAWNRSLRTIWTLQHPGGKQSFAEV